jgi:uncharacterized damage-inducible protein DinB
MSAAATADTFVPLFRYTRWADGRIIDALREADPTETREELAEARRLLSHSIRSQVVWLERLEGTADASLNFWATDALDACAERLASATERWIEAVRAGDLAAPVHYRNSSGTAFTNQRQEIAHHVVNHATHHRAQVARLLREAGHEPPATDFIIFARDPETNPRLRSAA